MFEAVKNVTYMHVPVLLFRWLATATCLFTSVASAARTVTIDELRLGKRL